MLADVREQHIAAALRAARPLPREGWEERALAALADIRPRRHPNLLTFVIVAALILLLAAGVFAAVRHLFYVEGTLRFHDAIYNRTGGWAERARNFSGEFEWGTEPDVSRFNGDISPDGKWVVYEERVVSESNQGGHPPTGSDLLLSKLDASEQVNLTEIAGLGGINCYAKWSPDGNMIAFNHCDPVEGTPPCDAGWRLWVMHADGSEPHQVTPQGAPPTDGSIAWSPDSSRLAAHWRTWTGAHERVVNLDQPTDTDGFTTDIWGIDIRPVPSVGYDIAWSPDGSMLVSVTEDVGKVGRAAGHWTQLLLTDPHGGGPRVLVEQFVSDADALAHAGRYSNHPAHKTTSDAEWVWHVRYWAGPCRPVWSPTGRQIAFLAALPFDPGGPYDMDQVEVWVYDLDTDELTRVTDDDVGQTSIIWK